MLIWARCGQSEEFIGFKSFLGNGTMGHTFGDVLGIPIRYWICRQALHDLCFSKEAYQIVPSTCAYGTQLLSLRMSDRSVSD